MFDGNAVEINVDICVIQSQIKFPSPRGEMYGKFSAYLLTVKKVSQTSK